MLRPREIPYERLTLLWGVLSAAVGLFALRLVYMQVLRNVYYLQAAEQNRTQTIYQNAPRGQVLDRNGRVLATNRPAFSVIYLPGSEDRPDGSIKLARDLAPYLHREPLELAADLRAAAKSEAPTRLAENLTADEMFRLSELKTLYAGIDLVGEARRYYPQGSLAAHLIGYIGAMDSKAWEEFRTRGYRADSWLGRTGVEKLFERQLRGLDGGVQLEVDAQGRLKKVLRRVPWAPGGSATLTIDLDVQRAAEEGLAASSSGEGAVVAVDVRTGDLLALASLPSYDPNLFLVRKDEQVQASLRQIPELNLALQGSFAPGSIFKIITGAAALNEGRLRPDDSFFCPGKFELGTRTFKCWKSEGHGRMSWIAGLANSCDVYFYHVGLRTGGALIEKYEKLFRVGERTHIALPGERRGLRFGPEARGRRGWWDGENLNLAIGQGELLVTPVQMAVIFAAVANGGILYRPHFVVRVADRMGKVVFERQSEVLSKAELKASTWKLLHEGLRSVVEEGTGRAARVEGLDVRGKTGTAQNPLGEDHAWFVAYAGLLGEEPELAVAVLVEHGGHGGATAAPIAKKVFQAYFRDRLPKPAPKLPPPVPHPVAAPAAPVPVPIR